MAEAILDPLTEELEGIEPTPQAPTAAEPTKEQLIEQMRLLEEMRQLETARRSPPPPPTTPSTTPSTTGGIFSVIPRSRRVALSGMLGAPGDILNLPGAISALVGGPDFRLPIGSDSIARGLGVPPESMSGLERILQTVSGSATPGIFLKAAGQVGILPRLAERLYKFFSASIPADIAMGTAAGVGAETGHAIAPQSGVAPLAGGVAGPLTLTGLRATVSAGVKYAGRRTVALQQAELAEETAARAKEGTRRAQQEVVSRQRAQRRAQRLVEQEQEQVRQAKDVADVVKERGALQVETAQQQLEDVKTTQALQTEQVEATGAGFERAAQQAVEAAQRDVATAFAPLDTILRQDILKERTVAGTKRAIPIPPPPGERAVGAAARADVEALKVSIPAKAAEEGVQLIDSIGPRLDRFGVLAASKAAYEKFFSVGRQLLSDLFEATEKVTGDAPAVNVARLRNFATDVYAEVQQTGQQAPRGTRVLTQLGLPKEEVDALLNAADPKLGKLTPDQHKVASAILEGTEYAEGLIPFWLSRRLESALSRIAYQNAPPIGSLVQGKARRMVALLQDDIHDFYMSPTATTVIPEIETALQALNIKAPGTIAEATPHARQRYAEFIQLINKSIISKILHRDPKVMEQFLKPFTTFGEDVSQLVIIKQTASPELWDTLGAFTLAELHRKASASGQFSMQEMAGYLKRLRRSGKMGILFDDAQMARIERYAHRLTSDDVNYLPRFRATLARKEPSEVIDFVFQPGKFEQTQNFRAVSSEETFDAAVKAWSATLMQDLLTLTPDEVYKKLAPLARRGRDEASQLGVMFTEYPGVAERIGELVQRYGPRLKAVDTAGETLVAVKKQAAAELAREKKRAADAIKQATAVFEDVVDTTRRERSVAQTAVETAQAGVEAERRGVGIARRRIETAELDVEKARDIQRWATDRLRDLRKHANVPEAAPTVYGYMRAGGIHIRTGGGAMFVTALMEALIAVATGNPLWALPGTVVAGSTLLFPSFAASRFGRATIRGRAELPVALNARWGPSTTRWVVEALGKTDEEEPPQ